MAKAALSAELKAGFEKHQMETEGQIERREQVFQLLGKRAQGSTAVCPWSTRARAGGTVAVPVSWAELDGLDRADAFDIFAAAERAHGQDA